VRVQVSLSAFISKKKKDWNGCLDTNEKDVQKRKAALFCTKKADFLKETKRKNEKKRETSLLFKKLTGNPKVIANEIGHFEKKKKNRKFYFLSFSRRIQKNFHKNLRIRGTKFWKKKPERVKVPYDKS
jgi:hypothetical protein